MYIQKWWTSTAPPNTLIEYEIPKKLVRLIKMWMNDVSSRVCMNRHLSDVFAVHSELKKGDALSTLLLILL